MLIQDQKTQMDDFAEIYTFVSDNSTYRYTSYSRSIEYQSNYYEAAPIQRGEFSVDLDDDSVKCSIQAPITTMFYSYIISTPYLPISVEIIRFYINDETATTLVFKGVVDSITLQKNYTSVECISALEDLRKQIPRIVIQSACNHPLYSNSCGVSTTHYTRSYVMSQDIAGPTLFLDSGTFSVDSTYYVNGIAKFRRDTRFICSQGVDFVNLYYPFSNLTPGSTVYLIAGCDKTLVACKDKFRNSTNFLGMPYVRKVVNPVSGRFV